VYEKKERRTFRYRNLLIVKPETVLGWHREGFKLFWTRLFLRVMSAGVW